MNERQTRTETHISGSWAQPNWITISGWERGEEPWAGGFRTVSSASVLFPICNPSGGLETSLAQQLMLVKAGHGWAALAREGRGPQRNPRHCDCSLDVHHPVSFQFSFF